MVCVAFSGESWTAMAEILPPEMPTSASVVSIAVTMVAFLMMVSKRMGVLGCWLTLLEVRCVEISMLALCSCHGLGVARQNITPVDFQGFFFFAAHQVDVELGYACRAKSF